MCNKWLLPPVAHLVVDVQTGYIAGVLDPDSSASHVDGFLRCRGHAVLIRRVSEARAAARIEVRSWRWRCDEVAACLP